MNNLIQQQIFEVQTQQLTATTQLSTLIHPIRMSVHDNIQCGAGSLLALYSYDENEHYQLVYAQLDLTGQLTTYIEDDGVLPTLFRSPDQQNFVSIVPYHPDKDMEISIPVFQREHVALPKSSRPFTGDFIGTTAQYAIFFDADIWSDTKPDKMLVMDFKLGAVHKKKNVKIELPRANHIVIDHDQIHLLAIDQGKWLHRQIDASGQLIQQRHITVSSKNIDQILSLSFEQDSYVLAHDRNHFFLNKINIHNQVERITLIQFEDPIFNTWQAHKIAEHSYVIQFNTEFGNGWMTVQHEQIVEFFYSKGVRGYKNLLNGELLSIEYDQIIISGIHKTTEHAYAVVMYPSTEMPNMTKYCWVMNRHLVVE